MASIVTPSSPEASRRMAATKQKHTSAEMAIRKALFHHGLRYRVDHVVLDKPRRKADIAFLGPKVAVFVDGCFWHGCPKHASWPKQNAEFWRNKIETNQARDADTNERLKRLGWTVIRVWEHEAPETAAEEISEVVNQAKKKHRR